MTRTGLTVIIPVLLEGDADEQRYLGGLYLETPEEFDDPYRYFRW